MCGQRFFTGGGQLQLAAVEPADDPAALNKSGQQRGAQCATEVRAAFAPVQAAAGEAAAGGGGEQSTPSRASAA